MKDEKKKGEMSLKNEDKEEKEKQQAEPKPPTSEEEIGLLKEELKRLTQLAEENHDRWLRAVAELENYKKRVSKEKAELTKFANEGLIKELLPVLDNLERAILHSEDGSNHKALLEGIKITHRQLLAALERFGIKRIEALHRPFDPNLHEAMMQVETDEHEPNMVVQELEKGYLLNDRLLRPARVAVSIRTEKKEATENSGDNDDTDSL